MGFHTSIRQWGYATAAALPAEFDLHPQVGLLCVGGWFILATHACDEC